MDKRTRANGNGERPTGCPRNMQMTGNIITAVNFKLSKAILV